MTLSALDRSEHLDRLKDETFDLVIIGGGVVGAGMAWDAALRGLSVALIEKRDFGSGTSSKSSKLLHGGLRYLEQGELHLVFESLAQRNQLFQDAPHVSKPLDFMFPIFKRGADRGWLISIGLWLYDLLSHLSHPRGAWHKRLGAAKAREAEPAVRADGLKTAFRYGDGLTEDARLVIETLKSADAAGALAVPYVEATGFQKDYKGHVTAVQVRDVLPGCAERAFAIKGRRIFVAAGPWVDAMLRLDDPKAVPRLRPTKGVHVVVKAFVNDHAVVMRSADPLEKKPRVMFVIPWEGRTIIGTTDTDLAGPPGEGDSYLDHDVEASPAEVKYLLDAVNRSFDAKLTPADVLAAFAGWRPLIAPATAGLLASAVSREHEVFQTKSGLWAIAGGKLTGYRTMARQAVDAVVQGLVTSHPLAPSVIERRELAGSELGGKPLDAYVAEAVAGLPAGPVQDAVRALVRRHGTNWPKLRVLLEEDPDLAAPLPGLDGEPRYAVEVVYAVRHEGAQTPADYLMRRTRLSLTDADQGLGAVEAVARIMAGQLAHARHWDEEAAAHWVRDGVAAYEAAIAHGRAVRAGEPAR